MGNEERWNQCYEQMMAYMKTYGHRPSKYRFEYHPLVNWLKYNRKAFRRGQMPEQRVERFRGLLVMLEKVRRLNQYAYMHIDTEQKTSEP